MASLRMLYIIILKYIFKSINFEMNNSNDELAKNGQAQLLYRLIFAIEWDHWEYCTPWSWPEFSRL